MMLTIKPILVLVFAVTIPLSLLFTRFMLKKTGVFFKKRSITLGEMNGYAEEMITGNKTIKAYVQEDRINHDFDGYNENATKAAYRAEYYGSITGPGVNFINNLSLTLVCIFGTVLALYNMISLGDMGSFVLYSRKFSGPINEIANIFVDLQSALAASERVFNLIDEDPEPSDKPLATELNAKGDVKFKNVTFGYDKTRTIIDDLSFDVKSGEVVAIVGPTGAGKTTIVNLLMRFYDIDSGEITVDGINISDIKRESLRNNYTMVLQDTWLFHGSVYENVSYGKKDATLDDVIKVCKAAKIHNFIMHLPKGYDTILIEGGTNISKGQKQLLTIARAMLLDKKMLILDEATSNVDTQTEIKIQDAMKELMKGKTCFIIAHRLSTIQNADLILVVNNGKIIEKGKHEELLTKNGFYKELYYSQFN
jgi:ATP-binding cassette subfamily B protein